MRADKGCCRLASSRVYCTGAARDLRPIREQACGCSSVRGGSKVVRACQAGTRRRCLRADKGCCRLASSRVYCTGAARDLRPMEQGCGCSLVVRYMAPALQCEVHAKCLLVCLADTPLSCLPTNGCRLPLCFAPEPPGISDRWSKVAAALWWCDLWHLHFSARCLQNVCLSAWLILP